MEINETKGLNIVTNLEDIISSAESGNYEDQYNLAELYYEGTIIDQNYDEAFKWYMLSANQGYILSQRKLGILYSKGRGVNQDYIKSAKWYELSANQGDAYSQLNLGLLYKKGQGVTQSYDEAFKWIKLSASQNEPISQFNLGLLYLKGQGVAQNYEEAAKWYELSANQGNYYAQYNLGLLYLKGQGVTQNYEKATYWITQAANQGDSVAQFNLGLLYVRGQGVTQNYEEAAKLFKPAADKGNSFAQFFLGYLYYEGLGVPQDYYESAKWYKLSAEQGNSYSQNNLGLMYELGQGVLQDYSESLKWYTLALKGGYEVARSKCEELQNLINEHTRKQRLHLYERKDVFISWNHLDQKIKNKICYELENRNLFTIWESDSNGSGNIDDVIEDAILQARSYIIILSGNSIESKWVEKELEIIFNKIAKHKEYENTIRPIVVNHKTIDGEEVYFDVFNEIRTFNDKSPFKKILNYCTHFSNEIINYDKMALLLKENISNSLKLEYKSKVLNKHQRFSSTLNNTVNSNFTSTKLISTTFSFDEGYLERPLYNLNNNVVYKEHIFDNYQNVLIYGVGGTGKTLFLKNYLRTQFTGNKYILYLSCKDIVKEIDSNADLLHIIKEKTFDIYFSNDEKELLTNNSFERIFDSTNEVILLIDGLDEISYDVKKILVEKLSIISNKYNNLHNLFTTRNLEDISIISSNFVDDINILELRRLELDDVSHMYDILNSKISYSKKIEIESVDSLAINPPSKKLFMESLDNISDEIKYNPLLLSNLIIVYLTTRKMLKRSFDVIYESVKIIINQIDFEKNISFKYNEYLKGEEINNILGYFSIQRLNNNVNASDVIIKDYLEDKYGDIQDVENISKEIYNYFKSRSIIINDRLSHNIFSNYFSSIYIYNLLFKTKRNIIGLNYIDYKDKNIYEEFINYYITNDQAPWSNTLVNLVYKLDYEIYCLNKEAKMSEKHLSYKVFNDLLLKIKDSEKVNPVLVNNIKNNIKKNNFYFNDFIKIIFKVAI